VRVEHGGTGGLTYVVTADRLLDCCIYPAIYAGVQALVLLYEGFGLPPLEAMACGTPVITSDTSSLPEVVGDAGIMVEPHDVRALVEAMEWLLRDEGEQRKMREKGLRQAAKFSWERTARATLASYRTVAPGF